MSTFISRGVLVISKKTRRGSVYVVYLNEINRYIHKLAHDSRTLIYLNKHQCITKRQICVQASISINTRSKKRRDNNKKIIKNRELN